MIVIPGTKVRVSVFVLPVAAALLVSPDAVCLLCAIGAALCHEAGHLFAMRLCGLHVERVSIYPFGADIRVRETLCSYTADCAVALAGPFVNLLFGGVFFLLFRAFPTVPLLSTAASHLFLCAVNLFPVKGLDGGAALYALLMHRGGERAERAFFCVSTAAFGVLCAFALALFRFTGYNLSLLLICAYLFLSGFCRTRLFPVGT